MSSLDDPKLVAVLDRLHAAARGDVKFFLTHIPLMARMLLGRQSPQPAALSQQFKDVYIPISREQGRFLYLVARSLRAKRIVEFGSSFGISTLYAAAAARDEGGQVIGSELEPGKQRAATAHLAEAGLGNVAEVRLGDAQETLRDVPGPIDLVLLDGWKELYLPMLQLLAPKLRPGAVVLADNIKTFRRSLQPFLDYVESGKHGFHALTLPLADGFEYAVRV